MASNTTNNEVNKPFDYSLRVSHKARHAKIQIKPYGGLEVVIPTRFPRKAVPQLVDQHAQWIEKHLALQQHRIGAAVLPNEIYLAINNRRIPVIRQADNDPAQVRRKEMLVLKKPGYQRGVKQLRQWLRNEAWKILPAMLERASHKTGLSYKKVSIRSQKTRWGSCSSSGTISLNDQLLFIDNASVEYLIIHELCHTRHMNHSTRFWQLVESHCANYRQHEAVLARARAEVPTWMLRDLYS
jgi:predicted metal-dependent hydrolase